MKLIIDNREKDLIEIIPELLKTNKLDYEYEIKALELGDFIIYNEQTKREELIIERKSLSDLASSIRDGRYAEQSLRLGSNEVHNHNIVYLIEGQMTTYKQKYTKIDEKTLYSTMFSLNYYKGFSVLRSVSIKETGELIIRILDKISREYSKGKEGYYKNLIRINSGDSSSSSLIDETKIELEMEKTDNISPIIEKEHIHYSSVVKKAKKSNITPENIGEIILSQIPGISNTISLALMKEYGSLYNLLMKLNENTKLLDEFSYITSKGQKRRISKKVISSIVNYLLYQRECEINIM